MGCPAPPPVPADRPELAGQLWLAWLLAKQATLTSGVRTEPPLNALVRRPHLRAYERGGSLRNAAGGGGLLAEELAVTGGRLADGLELSKGQPLRAVDPDVVLEQ